MIGDAKWEVGLPMRGPEPRPDSDETWHVHDHDDFLYGGHLECPDYGVEYIPEWGTSIKCTYCIKPKAQHGEGKKVHFNINRLQKQNEAGVTSRMMRDEIYASAKEEGRDITRAR